MKGRGLRRRVVLALWPVLLLGLLAGLLAVPAAAAGGSCPPHPDPAHPCVDVTTPGSPGGHHGGGGGNGGGGTTQPDPCPGGLRVGDMWAVLVAPQPPKSDPAWEGHTDGAVYQGTSECHTSPIRIGPWTNWVRWLATAPPPQIDPAVLARQALAALTLPAPVMHRSPTEANQDAGMPYTWVNLWTWYWTTPATWQTRSRTAALGPVWATVTVKPVRMTFAPGGGANASTCPGPGRPWTEADGNAAPSSGGCGVRYTRVAKAVTSTLAIQWEATWTSSTGAGGTLPVAGTQTSSTFSVQQIQVVSR